MLRLERDTDEVNVGGSRTEAEQVVRYEMLGREILGTSGTSTGGSGSEAG